ncbi:MAG: DUF3021 family protein [Methanocorpusculum sp.]|nr:DUF3021 family protein [Methanocorpusculum sp.]
MKFLKEIVQSTLAVLAVLAITFGVLCQVGLFDPMPFHEAIFPFLLMAICTTLFVTLRERILPEDTLPHKVLDIGGCALIVYAIVLFLGWMQFAWQHALLLLGMVIAVYLVVWALTWTQSKSDEEKLNALLKARKDVNRK